METNLHSVKRWQLSGTNYESPSETLLSSWTPLNHKETNLQVTTCLFHLDTVGVAC